MESRPFPLRASAKSVKAKASRPPDGTPAASTGQQDAGPLTDKLGRAFPPARGDVAAVIPGAVISGRGKTAVRQPGQPIDKEGRPFKITNIPETCGLLLRCGRIMATFAECAALLDITEQTLAYLFQRHPETRDAWISGKENGKTSLRRKQFNLANTSATMAIFLGTNYLGQRDHRTMHLDGKLDLSVGGTIFHALLQEVDQGGTGRPLLEHEPAAIEGDK